MQKDNIMHVCVRSITYNCKNNHDSEMFFASYSCYVGNGHEVIDTANLESFKHFRLEICGQGKT